MDFDRNKPTHLFAAVLLFITILITFIIPTITFFTPNTDTEIPTNTQYNALLEFFLVTFQLLSVFFTLVLVPLLWYILVNRYTAREVLHHIKLTAEDLPLNILYGVITSVIMFTVLIGISGIIQFSGSNIDSDGGNISILNQLFSIPTLFFLVAIQPIAEEFFFRGFLYDRINKFIGPYSAIILSGLLFGIIHISYNQLHTVIITAILGIILAFSLYKTKNFLVPLTAHILYNVISVYLYTIASQFV